MAMDTPPEKAAPMGANVSGRTVEITDEDETLVIAFVPAAATAGIHGHDHHQQREPAAAAMETPP